MQNEIKRVENIINTTKSIKLKNDMSKYLKKLKRQVADYDRFRNQAN